MDKSKQREMEEEFVCLNANRHIALYLKTGDGLLIWRAYQEFRKNGFPVPEKILKKFDDFASALSNASGAQGIADAVEMAVSGGGSSGWRRTEKKERQRDIVEFVRDERKYTKKCPSSIEKEAAKRFDTTPGAVKKLYSEWMRESKKSQTNVDFNPLYRKW